MQSTVCVVCSFCRRFMSLSFALGAPSSPMALDRIALISGKPGVESFEMHLIHFNFYRQFQLPPNKMRISKSFLVEKWGGYQTELNKCRGLTKKKNKFATFTRVYVLHVN